MNEEEDTICRERKVMGVEKVDVKMEMEQLLSMGFPNELAEQALAATGGKSTLKATEWILSRKISPSPAQPKLDRFFQSKPASSSSPTQAEEAEQVDLESAPISKRSKPNKEPLSEQVDLESAPISKRSKPIKEPLSERMRPRTIHEVVGQDHLLSPNTLLRSAIHSNRLPSIILWGPPGTGKTSIARAIVNSTPIPPGHFSSFYRFLALSAVTSGVKEVRDAIDDAKKLKLNSGKHTVLFVDEVHRFNKSQQDSFLPFIEDGTIVFMGATTENPSFHLITPLLSRCTLLTLSPLNPHHVGTILTRAVDDRDKGLSKSLPFDSVQVTEDAIQFLSINCDGDARVALNALEISAVTAAARATGISALLVQMDDVKEALQSKHLAYDKAGDQHYNLISALHKSMRGSDADASIYWLARMLEGGEQPLYIARRLVRFASEDVGLADPLALNQAVASYQACHFLGMPECNVILAQCVAYMALAPKSISVYRAIEAAQKVVLESVGQNEGVPLHLRNAPTNLMKELGYGKDYIYTPDNPSSIQTYLPSSLQGYKFLHWPPSKDKV